MVTEKIILENPERFTGEYTISKEKLTKAIEKAADKLESQIPRFKEGFAATCSVNYKYPKTVNNNWICGMHTGTFLLAYELTGNQKFREVVESHLPTYRNRLDKKIAVEDHDVGFVFSPSCVAAYKALGDENARQTALDAAEHLYHFSYSKKGGFILRVASQQHKPEYCRTMMDTLMNAPLLFWAGQETGRQEYIDAAASQNKITEQYLIREDASSNHHYQFDLETHKPLHGVTWQGYSDASCWSRGHAWGVYGFPIAYSYTKEPYLVDVHKDITYYMLNHLPEDMIPYWDFVFVDGDQPRDSSAGVVAVCGMDEMCKYLPDDAPQKQIFKNASARMLEAVIDNCTGDIGREYDGLICHVTAALPQRQGIDQCAIYGDYFYLEALCRMVKPDWKRYW